MVPKETLQLYKSVQGRTGRAELVKHVPALIHPVLEVCTKKSLQTEIRPVSQLASIEPSKGHSKGNIWMLACMQWLVVIQPFNKHMQ